MKPRTPDNLFQRGKKLTGLIPALFVVVSNMAIAGPNNVATVFKSASCGCCTKWVTHMKDNGFKVQAFNTNDVTKVKKEQGIPKKFWSCHTAKVGKYLIEGHVPAADIKKLIAENRPVAGLAVPGMPVGSPGMPGLMKQKYQVYEFDKKGLTKVVAQY